VVLFLLNLFCFMTPIFMMVPNTALDNSILGSPYQFGVSQGWIFKQSLQIFFFAVPSRRGKVSNFLHTRLLCRWSNPDFFIMNKFQGLVHISCLFVQSHTKFLFWSSACILCHRARVFDTNPSSKEISWASGMAHVQKRPPLTNPEIL